MSFKFNSCNVGCKSIARNLGFFLSFHLVDDISHNLNLSVFSKFSWNRQLFQKFLKMTLTVYIPARSNSTYPIDAATSSGILKAKQKLCVTFNSDKLGGIDFTKFSKLSICSAVAGRFWLVQCPGLPPRHFTWSVLKFL